MTVLHKVSTTTDIEVHVIQLPNDNTFRVWGFDTEFGEYMHRLGNVDTWKCPSLEVAIKKANEQASSENISVPLV